MKLMICLLCLSGWACVVGAGIAAEITIACDPVGQQQRLCREAATRWAEQTGNTVRLFMPPERTNELEWVAAYDGGHFVEAGGQITANNPRAALALARAASWIDIITPRRVTSFNEEDTRRMFQLGNAVFMRNWPYAWALLNAKDSPLAGKVGIAPLPRGGSTGRAAGTLGGWQLAVSRYSNSPEVAADLVRYLTGAEVQKQRALVGAYLPTLPALYEDAEILGANPFFADLREVLEQTVVRPSASTGAEYMAVSTRIWEAVWNTLQGKQSATESLADLENQLELMHVRSDGWGIRQRNARRSED